MAAHKEKENGTHEAVVSFPRGDYEREYDTHMNVRVKDREFLLSFHVAADILGYKDSSEPLRHLMIEMVRRASELQPLAFHEQLAEARKAEEKRLGRREQRRKPRRINAADLPDGYDEGEPEPLGDSH